MTPQLASMLTIHEEEGQDGRFAPGYGSLVAFPGTRVRAKDSDEHARPSLLRREAHRRRLLALADVLGAMTALSVVFAVFGHASPGPALLIGLPLVVVLFKIAGLYDRDQLRIVRSTLDEAPALAQLTGLYTLAVTIFEPIMFGHGPSSPQVAALWAASFAAIVSGRTLARKFDGRGAAVERCLVIGDRTLAERVREKVVSSRANSAVVATLPLEDDDVASIGSLEGLRYIVGDLDIHRIIVAPTAADAAGVVELIRIAKACGVRVSVLPRMLEVVGSSVEFEDVDGLTMLGVRPFGLSRSSRLLKRMFDLVAAAIGVVALAPVIAVIALAIRIDSKGPILFRQVRVGRDGKHFHIFKFRSMGIDAEAQKDSLRGLNEVGTGMFKITDDPRVTRVGNVLRKTSLDELPQIFNVLRGEMSLVGPRPLVTDEDAQVFGLDRSRLHLTPGMTGPWQILGARVPMQEMVGIDYLYVASWSLWLDVKVLLRTVLHVARSGNV